MPVRVEGRLSKLRAELEAHGLDGLIVTHLPNIRYLTGFTGSAGVLLVFRDGVVLLTDFRYEVQASSEISPDARVEVVQSDTWARLGNIIGDSPRVGRLGFESAVVTVAQEAKLRECAPRIQLEPVEDLVERLRASKDEDEIASIRQAASLAAQALEATLPAITIGVRELDVAARLENELRVRGSEWHPFRTIVACGPRTALPHAGASQKTLQAGDFVLIDFGAQVDGYCADLTRMFVVGARATEKQKTVYDLVCRAQTNALRHIQSGMTGRDADRLARRLIEEQGFGDQFGHSLGHGLGLEVHEAPRLSKSNDSPVPEGAVVTIEPGVYIPGWGGVRIEDDVLVTNGGAKLLSDGNTELVELV